MSQFNYADYQNVIAQAQNGDGNKVGYFKLKDDGDEALVRFNCASVEDLQFASVHTVQSNGKWMRVSCLNPLGNYTDSCPFCAAVKAGDKRASKASKKVYLQMLCAYKDKTTGQFAEAIPVIWERPAAFSRDIANNLKDFGDLKNVILKVTRNGAAGDMKTTYSINFVPIYNKPELVPNDFSAFATFDIAKHSYWDKSLEDINAFFMTGAFPETRTNNTQAAAPSNTINPYANMPTGPAAPAAQPAAQPAQTYATFAPQAPAQTAQPAWQQPVAPAQTPIAPATTPYANPTAPQVQGQAPVRAPMTEAPAAPVNPSVTAPTPGVVPQPAVAAGDRPVRNFSGFSF